MNPFRYFVNRNRFTSPAFHFLDNRTTLNNSHISRELIVVCSLLNELSVELQNSTISWPAS